MSHHVGQPLGHRVMLSPNAWDWRAAAQRCVREVGEREKERRCLGRGESRFGVKSSSVGNYQSLRNAATALTRQAAAWLQRLRKHANLLYAVHRSVRVYNLADFCHAGVWLTIGLDCCCCCLFFCHCPRSRGLFFFFLGKLGPSCSVQRDHIMGLPRSPSLLAPRSYSYMSPPAGMYPPLAHPLWTGETSCFQMGDLSLIKPTKSSRRVDRLSPLTNVSGFECWLPHCLSQSISCSLTVCTWVCRVAQLRQGCCWAVTVISFVC